MTLSDFAAIGSLVSGVAVLGSLVYLSLQVRQTERNQRSILQQGRSARVVDLILRRAEPHLSEATARAARVDPAMEPAQVDAVNAFCSAVLWSIEDSFMQHKAGLFGGSSWELDLATLRGFLRAPYFRVAWIMSRDLTGGEYRTFVDGLMEEIPPQRGVDTLARWKELMAKEIAKSA